MSNFYNLLNRKERHITNPGSTMANDYQITIDKKGHKVLKCVGEHDIYEEIQSYAEECKIENILARVAAGDTDALNRRQGFYEDITNSPANLAEAQNAILKLKQGFDELPAEIREKFDNSAEKFVKDFGSEEWAKAMGYETTTPEETKPEQTKQVTFDGMKAPETLTPEVSKNE